MMVFSGNAHPELSAEVTARLSLPLGKALVGQFSDGEVMVEIQENVRGRDVFVVQPTSAPTNENLMELLVMIDAMRGDPVFWLRASGPSAALGAGSDHRQAGGEDDRHCRCQPRADDGSARRPDSGFLRHPGRQRLCLADVVRARALAKRLEADLAIIDKRRSKANEAKVMNIIGDVEGRSCVLIDDLVDTAGTLCKAAKALKEAGAAQVVAYCTHPVLSGPAVENINASLLDELVVTNTIPLRADAKQCPRIRLLTIAGLLSETMRRIHNDESVTSLFID